MESESEGGLVIDEREEGELDEEEEEKTARGGRTLRTTTTAAAAAAAATECKPSGSGVAAASAAATAEEATTPRLPSPAAAAGTSAAVLNRRTQWSLDEMMLFYEGVKQMGRDFDAVHKFMSRRKFHRDKEHLRNFYFNFYKLVRSAADLKEEDWPSEVSRDARDLFVVINGCEWKKRTDNGKYEQAKLKALIMDGQTITRVRCKKQQVTIKTPSCPALLHFFTFNRRISRFPSDIILYLSPKTPQDGTRVLSRGQNRHLCIRLNTNDRLERVFDLLDLKWAWPDSGGGGDEGRGKGSERRGPPSIRLFPSRQTYMGDVVYSPSPSSYGNVSIKMLQEDRAKNQHIRSVIAEGSAAADESCYHATQSLLPHLTLSRFILLKGLGRRDVDGVTVAELYAVCGLSRELSLLYSIEDSATDGEEETWGVLVNLLTRGYGEAPANERRAAGGGGVAKSSSMDDGQSSWEPELIPAAVEPPARKKMKRQSIASPPPPQKKTSPSRADPRTAAAAARPAPPSAAAAAAPSAASRRSVTGSSRTPTAARSGRAAAPPSSFYAQSPIVSEEMEDFNEQLRSLSSRPRRQRSPAGRLPTTFDRRLTSISATPSTSTTSTRKEEQMQQQPLQQKQHHGAASSSRAASAAGSSRGKQSMGPTTFSAAMVVGGGTSDDPMARALRAAFTSPGNSLLEAPTGSMQQLQLQGSRRSGAAAAAAAAMIGSPQKTATGFASLLPPDVRMSVEQMMSQNSTDYCLNFVNLLQSTSTTTFDATSSPSKLARL